MDVGEGAMAVDGLSLLTLDLRAWLEPARVGHILSVSTMVQLLHVGVGLSLFAFSHPIVYLPLQVPLKRSQLDVRVQSASL